ATPGYEDRKGVILQGHMDMVPQKIASSSHDFLNDPITTLIDGDWVTADGTTLGADDGLGVALAMAVAESKDVAHGPLEILVTYDEETGMTGASSLKAGVLKGDILLNLDSEDEDELCIGCAGGLDLEADFAFKKVRTEGEYKTLKLEVSGLQGGHSGMDITLYRGNANKVIAYALVPVMEKYGVKLVSFSGGSLRNAIPFEAEAVINVPEDKLVAVKRAVAKSFKNDKELYKESDPSMKTVVAPARKAQWHIEEKVALSAVKSLLACPSNVIRMSQSMPGLTETSINMAIVSTKNGHFRVKSLMRSAIDASKEQLALRCRCIFEAAGAKVRTSGGYSGWVPRPDNPMIAMMNEIHEKMFGRKMNTMATHGGLECAIMGARYPHWEMISIGPTIRYPHSPDERTYIPSVQKSWDFLKEVLKNVPAKQR
ncbi:MAG: beta-Ala-His dipeptidase, partial [Bacteroidales bacterium]|nr:beta-Ala-His dipeptidase [Bacteroidales bacterium]